MDYTTPSSSHRDIQICNIIIFRNQYDRWLKYWERREEAYEKNPVGPKPSRTNPTAQDLLALAKTAPFFITTFRYLIIGASSSPDLALPSLTSPPIVHRRVVRRVPLLHLQRAHSQLPLTPQGQSRPRPHPQRHASPEQAEKGRRRYGAPLA